MQHPLAADVLCFSARPFSVRRSFSVVTSVACDKREKEKERRLRSTLVAGPTNDGWTRATKTGRRSGRSEGHPRSAEADVFIRSKICIRCSRSPIAKSLVPGGASRRFKEALCHYSRIFSPSPPLSLTFSWISWTS